MVTRDTPWPDGTPCWVDLGTADIPRAVSFYSSQFGWDIAPGGPEMGGYSRALLEGRNVAGIGPSMGQPDAPGTWATHLAVSDAEAAAARVTAAGGAIVLGPLDVMDLGRMVIATDVTGAAFGLWQAGSHTGVQAANVAGTFTWSEHMSHDFEGAKAFYAAVFGYEYGDMSADGFSYATVLVNEQVVGGIGAFPSGGEASHPAFWAVYFATADTDKAVELAVSLGGRVIRPPTDSPYGRMAIVADDQGAVFSLISAAGDD